jgi:hypothetical protein
LGLTKYPSFEIDLGCEVVIFLRYEIKEINTVFHAVFQVPRQSKGLGTRLIDK